MKEPKTKLPGFPQTNSTMPRNGSPTSIKLTLVNLNLNREPPTHRFPILLSFTRSTTLKEQSQKLMYYNNILVKVNSFLFFFSYTSISSPSELPSSSPHNLTTSAAASISSSSSSYSSESPSSSSNSPNCGS